MTWFSVSDDFHAHPKVDLLERVAGPDWGNAIALWTIAGSWCSQYGTGGRISRARLARLSPLDDVTLSRVTDALISVGLWEARGTDIQFHDWDDRNFTVDQERSKRDKAAERQRRRRARLRENRPPSEDATGRGNANVTRDMSRPVTRDGHVTVTPPVPSRPVPSRIYFVDQEERDIVGLAPDAAASPSDQGKDSRMRQRGEQRARVEALSRKAVGYLNAKTGRRFDPMADYSTKAMGKLLAWYDRAGRGGAAQAHQDAVQVIDSKVSQWGADPKMERHLQPATLFRLSNYERYLDEVRAGAGRPLQQGASVSQGLFALADALDEYDREQQEAIADVD